MTSAKMVAIHMVNLSKDGSEVSVLTSTKIVTGHMFVLFQSSSNMELQDFQILLYQIQQCPEAKHREHLKSDIQTNIYHRFTHTELTERRTGPSPQTAV